MSNANIGVSVIMPAYKAEQTIAKAIESVLCQTHSKLELIVVDDCSDDDTASVVMEYVNKDSRVKYIRNERNSGVSATRNNGIKNAEYDWIALLDSDDSWTENKLQTQLEKLAEHPECDICFTGTAYVNEKGDRSDYVLHVPEKVTYNDVLKQNVVSCSSVVVRKSAITENPMPDNRNIHEDFATWLSILKKSPYAVGVDLPMLIYRVSQSGKSGNKFEAMKMQWRTYRFCKVPFLKALYCFFVYALRNVKKYKSLKIEV